MGMCKPSGGFSNKVGRVGSLPRISTPNTRLDLYDKDGNLLQQAWYGPDGRVIWYRDWAHGGGHHEWPHDHYPDWENNEAPRPAYRGPNGEFVNLDYC